MRGWVEEREGIVIWCRFCGGSKDFVTFRCFEWRTIRPVNKKPKTSSQGEEKNRESLRIIVNK